SEMDMVTNSLKFFPVSTTAELRDLFLAIAGSPPTAPKPTKLDAFLATHPRVGPAFASAKTPDSFAHDEYQGINAFVLVNKAGERQAVRFLIAPEQAVHLDSAEGAKRAPDYLMTELPERLKGGPVTFRLKAQLAAPGDQTNDPSLAWPADRRVVELGTFTLDKAVPDSRDAEKKLLYLPGQLIDGVEVSDDPMVDIRSGAYALSFSRRQE
ncbi:MAG: catalase, partial [Methylobacteriaceae bacterium]|nr:catalase [Methylobacteriaceae bacterium]